MTEIEAQIGELTRAFIASVAKGNHTLEQLKVKLDDNLTYAMAVGVPRLPKALQITITALYRAIQHIEINNSKTGRRRDH